VKKTDPDFPTILEFFIGKEQTLPNNTLECEQGSPEFFSCAMVVGCWLLLPCMAMASLKPSPTVEPWPWMDATLSADQRVELLLAEMTNHEKNAQLSYGTRVVKGGSTNGTLVVEAAVLRGGIGGIGCELWAGDCPHLMAAVQAGLVVSAPMLLRDWVFDRTR
jgi:hypothetical protein